MVWYSTIYHESHFKQEKSSCLVATITSFKIIFIIKIHNLFQPVKSPFVNANKSFCSAKFTILQK